jgi:hypothetical protein
MYRSEADLLEAQRAYHSAHACHFDPDQTPDTLQLGNNLYQNMTPHPLMVYSRDGRLLATFGPCRTRAPRVWNHYTYIDNYLAKISMEKVEDLPDESPDRYLIVSFPVKASCPDRDDLVAPGGHVRDSSGRVIGCTGFIL